MALVRCKECRKKISDQSSACIKCGAPRVPAPPPEKASGSGVAKVFIAMALWAVLINLPYGDLDTPAQAASAAQAVPVAKAPPVTKPEKVSAASASDDRADSESVVDEFFVNNVEEIRQAAAESRVLLEKPIDSQNQCVLWVQGTVFPALREAGAKPANKVLDLDGITVWRMVTTDGPVTATCSGPDRKFVLQSHY